MIVGYLCAFVVVIAFAIYPSVAPIGLQEGASPFAFVILAMFVSSLGLGSIVKYHRKTLLPSQHKKGYLLLSILFLLEHICLLFALQTLKVPVLMSLVYTYPFIIAIVSIYLGNSSFSFSIFLSLLACLLGIALVLGFSLDKISSAGILFALSQAFLAAIRILLTSHIAAKVSAILLTARMLGGAMLLCIPFCFLFDFYFPESLLGWITVGVAGLSGIIGHTCLAFSVKRIEVASFGLIMNLEPIFAALLSAIVAKQILLPTQYIGCILVVIAVCFHTMSEFKKKVFT